MQKRPVTVFRENLEDERLFEIKHLQDNSKHHHPHANPHEPQHIQNHPQTRMKADPKKSKRSVAEDRNSHEIPLDSLIKRSIYNRFANPDIGQVEEVLQQDEIAEGNDKPEQSENQHQLARGFQQLTSNSFHSQENPLRGYDDQVQQIYRQNEGLKKQMALLEVSLHNETLTNEEQRAYIEVLKQALEIKLSENGLLGFIKSLNQRSNLTEADLFIELTNMKSMIDANDREKSMNEERSKELYGQIDQLIRANEQYKMEKVHFETEHDKMARELERVLEEDEILRNENEKLNQEKDSLLDYIEEIRAKYDQIEQENSISKENIQSAELKSSKLQTKTQDLSDKLVQSEEKSFNISQNLEQLSRSHEILQKKYEELQKRYENLKEQQKDDTTQLEQLIEKMNKNKMESQLMAREHEKLKADHKILDQDFSSLKQIHEDNTIKMRSSLEEVRISNIEKEELIEELRNQRALNEELIENQKRNQDKISNLLRQVTEHKITADKAEDLERHNSELERDIKHLKDLFEETRMKTEKDRQSKADEIKALYQQASDLRIELRSLKEDYHRLQVERDGLESNNNELNQELEKKQRIIISYLKDINDFKQISEEKQEQLVIKISQIDKFENQINQLNQFVREYDEKLRQAYEAEEKLTRDLDILTKENRTLKEENASTHQRYEKSRKDLEEIHQLTIEIIRATGTSSHLDTKSIEENLRLIYEAVKSLKNSEEQDQKKWADIEYEYNIFKEEIRRLEEKNIKLAKSETDINNENKKLRNELEKLKEKINEEQKKNDRIQIELEKLGEDYEKKIREDDLNFKEQAKSLEDKVTRLISEKSSLEYILSKYREITINLEINDLLEQARAAHIQISFLDKDKLDAQIKIDMLKNSGKVYERGTPSKGSSTVARRGIESLKENIGEIDSNIEIYETKKQSIENELTRLMAAEREKYFSHYELERQNTQLKGELELITKELQLTIQARDTLETSYNDIVKGMRRSRIEERLNTSLSFPEGTFGKKSYAGKGSEDFYNNQDSIKKEMEGSGRLSNVSSTRRHRRDESGPKNLSSLK